MIFAVLGVEKLFPLITECLEMLLLCHPDIKVSNKNALYTLYTVYLYCFVVALCCCTASYTYLQVAYHKVLQTKSAGQQASLEKECITQAMM